jgi:hypothetical protein
MGSQEGFTCRDHRWERDFSFRIWLTVRKPVTRIPKHCAVLRDLYAQRAHFSGPGLYPSNANRDHEAM